MNVPLPKVLQGRIETFIVESGLPREVVDELINHHTVVTYPKVSTLFLQGAPADMLFWIFSGMVEVFCPYADGSRVLLRLCGPGEVLKHVDFIDHKKRRAQVFEAIRTYQVRSSAGDPFILRQLHFRSPQQTDDLLRRIFSSLHS